MTDEIRRSSVFRQAETWSRRAMASPAGRYGAEEEADLIASVGLEVVLAQTFGDQHRVAVADQRLHQVDRSRTRIDLFEFAGLDAVANDHLDHAVQRLLVREDRLPVLLHGHD